VITATPTTKRLTVATRRASLPVLHRLRSERYSDADPYAVLDIPAVAITHLQRRWDGPLELPWLEGGRFGVSASLRRRWHAGAVLDGDWDLATDAFEDYHLTRVLRARFHDGRAWEDIPYVRKALRKVRAGEPAWGGRCREEAEVHARCRYLDDLHRRLATDGYRPDRGDTGRLTFTHFLVNIGRDGTIVRNNDGKHRIILSRLIGLPSLPARVLVRHRRWQQVRDDVRRGGEDPSSHPHRDHPDLQDLWHLSR
jgi:hypothetical protein